MIFWLYHWRICRGEASYSSIAFAAVLGILLIQPAAEDQAGHIPIAALYGVNKGSEAVYSAANADRAYISLLQMHGALLNSLKHSVSIKQPLRRSSVL